MKKLFFISFILGIGIGFYGCNFGDMGNSTTFPPYPAVAGFDFNMGGATIRTPFGIFSAPSLTDALPGDCLFISQFTIDYDNQPSNSYYTATDIVKESVEQSSLEQSNSIYLHENSIPLTNMDGFTHMYFNGKLFITAAVKDKAPNFRMVYDYDEPAENGIKNLYVIASSVAPNSEDILSLHAFDLQYLLFSEGRDSTVALAGSTDPIDFKYIYANLKYLSKISEEGEPEFKSVNTEKDPYLIVILKNY